MTGKTIATPFNWTLLFRGRNRVYTQLAFWMVLFSLFILFKEYPLSFTGASLICIVLQQTLEFAIPCYTQNGLVLPVFRRGKWLTGLVLYIAQLMVLIFLLPYILNLAALPFVSIFHIEKRIDWRREHITFSVIAFTVMATIFKIALDKLILDREQKETELKHLKAQLNPHFLFNTLNNLYGLSVVQSEKLPELMLKLSDLLRYSLYDTNQTYVSLEKELTYITNYIELEKIRLDDKTGIEFTIRGDVSDQYIAPLLLIVFVENAFKHYSSPRGRQAFVRIHFTLQDNFLRLSVCNSLDESLPTGKQNAGRGGIGLENVRQRLQLLYPGKHTLKEKREAEYYTTELEVDLS